MNQTKLHFLFIALSSVSIITSFFLGYLYCERQYELQNTSILQQKHYIDIMSSTKGIEIQNLPENIYFRMDWDIIQTGSIDLK